MLSNFTPLFFIFLTALFSPFCYASFSLQFTAGPQRRGACLLTLSPEGAGKKLTITMSKYVHAKSPLLKGIVGCLLAYAVRDGELEVVPWPYSPPFTTVIFLSHVHTHSGDRCLCCCLYCSFLSSWVKQAMLTLTYRSPGWRGRVCPVSWRTWIDGTNAMGHWRRKRIYWCTVTSSESTLFVSKLWTLKLSSTKVCGPQSIISKHTVLVFQYNGW